MERRTAIGRRWVTRLKAGLWLAAAFVMLYPLIWVFLSSLKGSNLEVFSEPFSLPNAVTLENYERAIREGRMGDYFVNSCWVTVLSCAATVVFGSWAGFALSKRTFPFQRLWLALFLLGLVLPVQSFLIPLIDLLERFRIHDSLWALILPYTAQNLPLAILLFAAYFRALPIEIEEAARLDGVSTARFYLTILLPTAQPAVATTVVISCLNTWNEFLMALLFIVDPEMKTLPVGMIAFQAAHSTDYPALLAGLSLISLPLLLVYAVLHKQIIRGVIAGALK